MATNRRCLMSTLWSLRCAQHHSPGRKVTIGEHRQVPHICSGPVCGTSEVRCGSPAPLLQLPPGAHVCIRLQRVWLIKCYLGGGVSSLCNSRCITACRLLFRLGCTSKCNMSCTHTSCCSVVRVYTDVMLVLLAITHQKAALLCQLDD
jgi:hypothetical protein